MEKSDIVINGRAQVVEILKKLPEDHKNKILRSLHDKNSTLAHELSWQTLSFTGICQIKDDFLKGLLEYVSSPVIAIALSDQTVETQKRFLTNLSRERAKEVFHQLKSTTVSAVNAKKAQMKITEVATTLIQKKILSIN